MNLTDLRPDLPKLPAGRLQARRVALLDEISRDQAARARPRRSGLRVRLAFAAVGTAVAAAIVAILLPTGSAYGSWTATPQPVDPTRTAAITNNCRGRLANMPTAARYPTPRDPVLAERRGDITVVVLSGPDSHGFCLVARKSSFTGLGGAAGKPVGRHLEIVAAPSKVDRNNSARIVIARVDGEVGAVEFGTTDGRRVVATVNAGWCVAWWPSAATATHVLVKDHDGATLQNLDQPAGGQNPPNPTRS
jgi:hypothetical protein